MPPLLQGREESHITNVGACNGASVSLPDEQKDRSREPEPHRHIEYVHGALHAQKALYPYTESQPDEIAQQSGKDEVQSKACRVCQRCVCARVQLDAHRTDADEPGLGTDPLKSE